MDPSKFNMYKSAADIANLAMEKAIELCHKKMKASFICKFCDNLIAEKLSLNYKKLSKGVMLPTCLSINSIVSHDSYTENDDYQLLDGDIVKIELATHIDNNVASIGETIKVGDQNWEENDLFIAATKAMQIGIQMIKPGTEIIEFKNYVEKVINKFGFYQIQRPNVYCDPDTIIYYDWSHRDNGFFCEPSWVVRNDNELFLYDEDELSDDEYNKEQIFTTGEVYHLTIAISNSLKTTFESSKKPVIFQKTQKQYHLKSKNSRELLNHVTSKFGTACWKISNLELQESKVRLGLKECLQHGVIRQLGIIEQSKSDILLLKCSIVINDNSVYKLTGNKYKKLILHEKLGDELNDILKQSKQFNKRSDYLNI